MTPESVGIPKNAIVLGKHSGSHAFEERLHELGYTLDHEKLEKAFEKFKILADKKKVIKDRDLEGLIGAVPVSGEERYTLDRFVINSGNTITSTAVITRPRRATRCSSALPLPTARSTHRSMQSTRSSARKSFWRTTRCAH